jgi:hypothetical protein
MKVLWAKAKHMGQKCGASGNILGLSLGTWGTIWKHNENTWEKKQILHPPPQTPTPTQNYFKLTLLVACWAFSLTMWKLWFINWLSPFFLHGLIPLPNKVNSNVGLLSYFIENCQFWFFKVLCENQLDYCFFLKLSFGENWFRYQYIYI